MSSRMFGLFLLAGGFLAVLAFFAVGQNASLAARFLIGSVGVIWIVAGALGVTGREKYDGIGKE